MGFSVAANFSTGASSLFMVFPCVGFYFVCCFMLLWSLYGLEMFLYLIQCVVDFTILSFTELTTANYDNYVNVAVKYSIESRYYFHHPVKQ